MTSRGVRAGECSGIDQQSGSPAVFVTLDGQAASNMFDVTSSHVGDPMAVLFTENKINTRYEDGEEIRERMSGNLCRCGAYANIVAAIEDVAGGGQS